MAKEVVIDETAKNVETVVLCMKMVESDNRKFPVFYGYHQIFNPKKNDFDDVLVPSTNDKGEPTMKPRNFKVVLQEPLKSQLIKENKFPYRLSLEPQVDYFITIDKDKDKKPRLDKYGKKHALLVISTCASYTPLQRKSMTFDDMDDVE